MTLPDDIKVGLVGLGSLIGTLVVMRLDIVETGTVGVRSRFGTKT